MQANYCRDSVRHARIDVRWDKAVPGLILTSIPRGGGIAGISAAVSLAY